MVKSSDLRTSFVRFTLKVSMSADRLNDPTRQDTATMKHSIISLAPQAPDYQHNIRVERSTMIFLHLLARLHPP
jgi:hypothetical protein